jgi:hypothetical protein
VAHMTAEGKLGTEELGVPQPRVFWGTSPGFAWLQKELTLLATTKSLQEVGDEGDKSGKEEEEREGGSVPPLVDSAAFRERYHGGSLAGDLDRPSDLRLSPGPSAAGGPASM